MLDFDSLPIQLYNHQKEGVKRTLQHLEHSHILSMGTGTGKSFTALATAKLLEKKGIPTKIIIPPPFLRTNWEREIERMGNSMVELYSWTKMPEKFNHKYFLIGEECHLYSSGNSRRTGNFLNLALPENNHVYGTQLISGTVLSNGQPRNLYSLLQAVKHPIANNKKYFDVRYCEGHLVDYISPKTGKRIRYWDNTGATNLKELWNKTKDSIYHVRKEDCLDLPQHTRIFKEIDFTKEEMCQYRQKLSDVKSEYFRRIDAGEIFSGAEHMVFLGAARKIACEFKIPYTETIINKILEEKGRPIVFCSFIEPLQILSKKYSADLIHGGVTDRQSLVDKFNDGEKKILFIQTQTAVGFNIQAGNYGIFIDRTYSPKDFDQCEARYNRNLQTQKTTSIWLQHGIDSLVDQILLKKTDVIDLILTGKRKTFSGIKTVAQLAPELLREIFDY